MIEKYFPDEIAGSIRDIDLGTLSKSGIKGLILDIDNTLAPGNVKDAGDDVIQLIKSTIEKGFKICLVSNATKKRVSRFNEKLGLMAIHRAAKPRVSSLLKSAGYMGIKASETAVIGDQIFTDIRGGNKAGMHTILVQPIHEKEFFWVKLRRLLEKIVMSEYRKHIKRKK